MFRLIATMMAATPAPIAMKGAAAAMNAPMAGAAATRAPQSPTIAPLSAPKAAIAPPLMAPSAAPRPAVKLDQVIALSDAQRPVRAVVALLRPTVSAPFSWEPSGPIIPSQPESVAPKFPTVKAETN